jgi:hypothetical protein
MVMPKYKITKTYEFIVEAEHKAEASNKALSVLHFDMFSHNLEKIIDTKADYELIEEPIEVAYTGWETLIKQGIDEWKFEYEISSYELYVDGDLYHLKQQLHTYWDFVEYAKLFVKGEAECLKRTHLK